MAEKKAEVEHGSGRIEADETSVEVSSTVQTSKRCSSLIPESEPPFKCPRSDSTSFTTQMPDPGDEQSEVMKQEMETLTERPVNPREQNKSWRRNTITRRSLPALPNPYESERHFPPSNISPSLSQQERLEKLLEASMEMALERTQNSLESFPKASLDSFKKQVENIKMEWSCLTKNTSNEPHKLSSSQPKLKAESESWEALMNKHKKSAEELEKKVKMGQETGIPLNSTLIVQSSQNSVIQSKPNYHNVLCRQQPMMHTMAMIMDTQCKMIQQLLTIKEQSQLLVKKTSVQLAEEAGFQELSSNLLKNLMSAPLQKATT
ncbi:hypothetical protein CCH79_00008151 [Gambusia affinis]|uniref:DSN1 component of MIS12 kinetochore complex n=1 Tax=Gambusia affinis TaxID=33528 RepID=A0A315VEW3_GAMAF|nr:hypothetical protein CCH79_00008151 [Gambusia affinis]